MGETELIFIIIFFNLLLIIFIVGIVTFVWQYRLKKKAHEQKINELDQIHKEEILKNEYEIQKETMKGIGREIHDNVGQKLTLAILFMHSLPKDMKEEVRTKINDINLILHDSLEELRHLSKTLTDNRIENSSIVELIQQEINNIEAIKKVQIHSLLQKDIFIASYQIKAVILRITQEFLQNSLKHAQCKNIYVELTEENNEISLKLKDDGIGFKMKEVKDKGIGIQNITKRSSIINAKLRLKSIINKGTILELKIPNHEK